MFVFQEPSLLSSLQDNGLTDVMLHALLIKDVRLQQSTFVLHFCFVFCLLQLILCVLFSHGPRTCSEFHQLLSFSSVQTEESIDYLFSELFICFGCVCLFILLLLHVFSFFLFQVPATREVLGSLPNVFSALCLNARGLHSFVQCQPFERLFKVLLSPDYLPAMRRRRSSDPLGELWIVCAVFLDFPV